MSNADRNLCIDTVFCSQNICNDQKMNILLSLSAENKNGMCVLLIIPLREEIVCTF